MNGYAAIVPPGGASKYFVSMFNRFHECGGFRAWLGKLDALVSSSNDTDILIDPSALDDVWLLTEVLYNARFLLAKKWVHTMWPLLYSRTLSIIDRYVTDTSSFNLAAAQVLIVVRIRLCVLSGIASLC